MDLGNISDLLDIVERTFHRPKLKVLHDAALAELEQMAADLAAEQARAAEEAKAPEPEPEEPQEAA